MDKNVWFIWFGAKVSITEKTVFTILLVKIIIFVILIF